MRFSISYPICISNCDNDVRIRNSFSTAAAYGKLRYPLVSVRNHSITEQPVQLLSIQDVPGLTLSLETSRPDTFSWFSSVHPGIFNST